MTGNNSKAWRDAHMRDVRTLWFGVVFPALTAAWMLFSAPLMAAERQQLEPWDESATNIHVVAGLHGDIAAFGASNSERDDGKVFVFQNVDGEWQPMAIIEPPAMADGETFARQIATDGDTIVVGAPDEDWNGMTDAGAVYVFSLVGGEWVYAHRLTAEDARADARFGELVAIEDDNMIVTSHRPGGPIVGPPDISGYIFQHDNQQGEWQQVHVIDEWIRSVDIAGNLIGVGEPASRDGGSGAYLFEYDGMEWNRTATLSPSVPEYDYPSAGEHVRLDENTVVIAGSMDRPDNGELWETGRVWVYERTDTGWSEVTELTAPEGAGPHFGDYMDFGGNAIVATNVHQNDLWLFEQDAEGGWQLSTSIVSDDTSYLLTPLAMTEEHLVVFVNDTDTSGGQDDGLYIYSLDELLGRPDDGDSGDDDSGQGGDGSGDDQGNNEGNNEGDTGDGDTGDGDTGDGDAGNDVGDDDSEGVVGGDEDDDDTGGDDEGETGGGNEDEGETGGDETPPRSDSGGGALSWFIALLLAPLVTRRQARFIRQS